MTGVRGAMASGTAAVVCVACLMVLGGTARAQDAPLSHFSVQDWGDGKEVEFALVPQSVSPPPQSEYQETEVADMSGFLQVFCTSQEGTSQCPPDAIFCDNHNQCGVGYHCLCERGCHRLYCQPQGGTCARHPIPKNGYVEDAYNSVKFFCSDTHRLLGPSMRRCVEGTWQPQDDHPRCKIVKCDTTPVAPTDGFVEFSPTGRMRRVGTRASFTCKEGYSLHGNAEIRCVKMNATAQWTGPAGVCKRNGGWGDWGNWTSCSVTCQAPFGLVHGVHQRTRACDSPTPDVGGKNCVGEIELVQSCTPEALCSLPQLPLEGAPAWLDWSNCSMLCGMGEITRSRNCSAEETLGMECDWNQTETQKCWERSCPVDGGWSDWTPWTVCSASCGYGVMSRNRTCDNPLPMHGGRPCMGDDFHEQVCMETPCPVDGGWSTWNNITDCSNACGYGGLSIQQRDCTDPRPQHGGSYCQGAHQNIVACESTECPVDGGWSAWVPLQHCSVSCGNGTMYMLRMCTNPVPSSTGRPCVGEHHKVEPCYSNTPCPVDGGWSEWQTRSPCSVTCGVGAEEQVRRCDSPQPSLDGMDCIGEPIQWRLCQTGVMCPVDGRWKTWDPWSLCPVSCGRGTQERSRECEQPQHGGRPCDGDTTQVRDCNVQLCPIHGNWSDWDEWNDCSASCDSGLQRRYRYCNNPQPQLGGLPCSGLNDEIRVCNKQPCPVDGGWSDWGNWTQCSVSCGNGGTKIRQRLCNSPYPSGGGQECVGDETQQQSCAVERPCPIEGRWSDWDGWSVCSNTCGQTGISIRTRRCDNPEPQHGGRACQGQRQHVKVCTESPCPVNGYWHNWGAWSVCDAHCGNGLHTRTRSCQPPRHGGQPCAGSAQETALCSSKVACSGIVHLGCFSAAPWTGRSVTIAFRYPLLKTKQRCLHRCRSHLTNYAIFRGSAGCWCANAYNSNTFTNCNFKNFHVAKGLSGRACTKRVRKVEPYTVNVPVSSQQRFTTKCGFLWWSRCTRYRSVTIYRQATHYRQFYQATSC